MALNNRAVITPGTGFVWSGSVGTARPTPAEIKTLNPITFGAQTYTITQTGSPTGGTWKLKKGTEEVTLPANATAEQIQAQAEKIPSIGVGNVSATGGALGAGPVTLALVGLLHGVSLTLTIDDTGLTGGSTPKVTIAQALAPNGWGNVGHTSRDEMPEFGFDGGEKELKGTWQNQALREVASGDAAADFVTMQLNQFDSTGLGLYYGPNKSTTPGVFEVQSSVVPTNEKALLVVIVDGDLNLGFHAHKTSVRREEAVSLPSDEFAALPIRWTFLKHGNNPLFSWINEDFFPLSA